MTTCSTCGLDGGAHTRECTSAGRDGCPEAARQEYRAANKDATEAQVLNGLDLVFEWHKVPGEISYDVWLAEQVTQLRAELEAARAELKKWDELEAESWAAARAEGRHS